MHNKWLVAGGVLSVTAAFLHLAIIFGGPAWYRFFGAGEKMARAAEFGSVRPVVITIGIAAVLLVWALYAFSGAGLIRPLPLLRAGLVTISAVYLLRAVVPVFVLMVKSQPIGAFWLWSSEIVLVYGICYALGTRQAWASLAP